MASAKSASTTRRSSSSKGSKKGDEPEISPARWGGVALVIAAIVAAVVLAVISPSDPGVDVLQPGTVAVEASPTPTPSVLDTRVPTAQPRITNPGEGLTPEVDIAVTVEVPEETLGKKHLDLVILRGEVEVGREENPKPDSIVVISGVRLLEGVVNELTAVLEGPGGLGPPSSPVLLTQDPDAPRLAITSPPKGKETYDKTIIVSGTSEVGAEVRVSNEANGWGPKKVVVGASGEFDISVPLKIGKNRILAESVDQVQLTHQKTVRVVRKDGQPRVDVDWRPEKVKKTDLPRKLRVVVEVTDDKGEKMAGANVAYTLGAPGYESQTTEGETDASGRSIWTPTVEWSNSSADALELGVTVTAPHGEDTVDNLIPLG